MKNILISLIMSLCMLSTPLLAKGSGVGFWMEGVISNLEIEGNDMEFKISGRFWFEQTLAGQQQKSIIEVELQKDAMASVTQADTFFAMTSDWRGGAIRERGALAKMLSAAEKHGYRVKFRLQSPQIKFDAQQKLILEHALVIRATDFELQ